MTGVLGAIRVLSLSLALAVSACGGEPSRAAGPLAPTPAQPSVSGPTVALTGRVVDDAGLAVAGAGVGASPLRWTAPWSGPPRSSQSDASGRYHFASLPQHPDVAYVRAWKAGYVQQCAVAVTLDGDASADLTIAEYANARISGLPTAPNLRQVSGTVYELTEDGRRPVAGAWVGWEPIMDTVVADTRTDANGRYRLCGLPTTRIDSVFVLKLPSNRPVMATVDAGGDAVVDFEWK